METTNIMSHQIPNALLKIQSKGMSHKIEIFFGIGKRGNVEDSAPEAHRGKHSQVYTWSPGRACK